MSETAPPQKQDIDRLYYELKAIVQLLEKVIELVKKIDAVK